MTPLKIDIITLFPGMFLGPFQESMLKKAQERGLLTIQIHDLRNYSNDKHHKVDDKQFGGGPGMLLKVEPLVKAIEDIASKNESGIKPWIVYLSPQGSHLKQAKALELSQKKHLIVICGHYEGIDERAMEWIDEEISIGDFVLTGGEIPAMVLVDTVARMVPGVVKEWKSIEKDSFFTDRLDYAHYTRPVEFKGQRVPEVLLSGNHQEIEKWRQANSFTRTVERRPDIVKGLH